MDCLPDKDTLCHLINNYGSFALFGLLALGIIALPVPEETLMVFAGILIDSGHIHPYWTLIAAYGGSMTGITVSYLLGRWVGLFFLKKHGKWVGISEAKIDKAHRLFEKYGKWTLFFGYFIPGVRHFTGFFAGVTLLEYHLFALFAYLGAFLWVTVFVSLGFFLGSYGLYVFEWIESRVEVILLGSTLLGILFLIGYKFLKKNGQS